MLWILLFLVHGISYAAGPVYVHKSPEHEEFTSLYKDKAEASMTPRIYIGAGSPTFASNKIGDLFVSTSTAKIYVSTSAAVNGWVILN